MKTLKNLLFVAMLFTFTSTFVSCTEDEEVENLEKLNEETEKNATTEKNLVDPKDVKPPTNG